MVIRQLLLLGCLAAQAEGAFCQAIMSPVKDPVITGAFAEPRLIDGKTGRHLGEDLHAPEGTVVRAIADGKIIYSRQNRPGYGQYIVIEHPWPSPFVSVYGHLSRQARYPMMGEGPVKKGDIIGYTGSKLENGDVDPHLHFAIHKKAWDAQYHYYGSWPNDSPDPKDDVDVDSSGNVVGGYFTKPSTFLAANSVSTAEITSLTQTPQQAAWVYYQSNCQSPPFCQWYISHSSGTTYLLANAKDGFAGEMVWGEIANGNAVATLNYAQKSVSVAPVATSQTPTNSFHAETIAPPRRNLNVVSSRGYGAAQEVAGKTMLHAWYFFKVPTAGDSGIWYIVNVSGTTSVMRLRLKPDNSDYDWLPISNSAWKRNLSGSSSSMTITLSSQ